MLGAPGKAPHLPNGRLFVLLLTSVLLGRLAEGAERDLRIALAYAAKIEALIGQSGFVQPRLFHCGTKRKVFR
jgi:hypothetical protein